MQLGVSSMIFEYDDLITRLPIMRKEGVFYVEIRGYPPRVDYRDKNYLKKLRDALIENGIKIHSYHLPFHPEDGFDISVADKNKANYAIDEIKLSLDAMLYLGGKMAVLHPGDMIGPLETKEERSNRSMESIGRILEVCEKANVRLAIENMLPGKVGERVSDVQNLISAFNSKYIGICFDTSHANVVSRDAPNEIKGCSNKLWTIHVSDNNGDNDQHYLPFNGNINWRSFWLELNNLSYKGVFMLEVTCKKEPRPSSFTPLEDASFLLQQAKRRFERIISSCCS